MNRGLIQNVEGLGPVCHGEERADPKSETLDLLVRLSPVFPLGRALISSRFFVDRGGGIGVKGGGDGDTSVLRASLALC